MILDSYQKDIVECNNRNILIIASPGSGKTTVIVNRAGYVINKIGLKPQEMIIITFTRAAAENMKNRFINMFGKEKVPFFGTFHAFFYSVLRKYYGSINLIEQRAAYNVIANILKHQVGDTNDDKIREILNIISSMKCSRGKWAGNESNVDKRIIINCYNGYEEYLKKNNLFDFDDLQIKTLKLFLENSQLLEKYRNYFKYYMVDEFQDCDEVQIELLKLLTSKGSIFAVGDEDQCIYGFRGSRPDYMVEFDRHFPNGIKKYLCNNYRSGTKIVETASNLIQNNIIRNNKDFIPVNKWNGNVCYLSTKDGSEQGMLIIERIRSLMKNGDLFKDNVILYRTNIESKGIIDSLVRNKIPFSLADKEYNFYDHFICKDIISYIKLSRDLTDRKCFCRIANRPFRYISKITLEKINKYKYKEDCFEIAGSIYNLPFFQFKELNRIKRDIVTLKDLSPAMMVDFIMERLEYKKFLKEYCKKNYNQEKELEEIVEEFRASIKEFKTVDDFLEHIEKIKKEIEKNDINSDNCVLLSTIHGVKGMEFKNVFIINCVKGYIPYERLNKYTNIEEERRVFYVAITRAMKNVFMLSPQYIREKITERSIFIDECQCAKVEECQSII